MDQGRSGLADTYQCLSNAGITPIGYGRNAAESARPILIRKGHIRVALFNSVLLPLENWVYLDGEPGICQLPADALAEAIGQYKRTHPDTYVVVILHWGMEYQASPTLSQRMGAHKLVAAGTDAVVGHHPHVVQPEEYIDGRPVFYSLGNFVFDQRKPETSQSLLVQLDFTDKGISVKQHWATIRQCKPILKTSQPPPAPSVRRESSPVHRESAGDDPFALAITAWVPYLCWR
jgi:poly-gamma-glutamate synthesis protein (capsule biosynthesis protein)